jgi:cytochrome b
LATILSQLEAPQQRIKVWDLPLRLFHWALVVSIAIAFLSSEEDGPLGKWHMAAGWAAAVLLVFRLVWGFVGGEHSRFSDFLRPSAIGAHVSGLFGSRTKGHLGHNPLGALAIVILLSLTAVTVGTGAFGGEASEELHETIAWTLLAMVGLHVAAVIVMSVLERESLVRAMITGTKSAARHPGARDARSPGLLAWTLGLGAIAGTLFLILQYDPLAFSPRSAEVAERDSVRVNAAAVRHEHEEDDD